MKLINKSLKNPAIVAVVTAIVVVLGILSFRQLPFQLFPDIDQPIVFIRANWASASPTEMESEIIKPLEEVMQGISGLKNITSNIFLGAGNIRLEFAMEAEMDSVAMEVTSRLNRLPPLPADSDPPTVSFGGFSTAETLIWYFVQLKDGNWEENIEKIQYIEDYIKPKIESIKGVGGVQVVNWRGRGRELQIIFDPYKAASLGIDLSNVTQNIGPVTNISGGLVDVGKRRYILKFESGFDPENLKDVIIDQRPDQPIRLGDIARIIIDFGQQEGFSYQNGNAALGFQIFKANGANVLDTLGRVADEISILNSTVLINNNIKLEKSFDSSVFIKRAVNLLSVNLVIGIICAIGALWWFIRQARGTLLIAISIPVSLLATFLILNITGRSLNVISLAGLAFASGMVLDAAIVVLENIIRLKEKGLDSYKACKIGTQQVWGALLASTITTIAIFIPILFLEDVEAQIFSDLALTIAIAVTASLIIAVTVLPVAAHKWLNGNGGSQLHEKKWDQLSKKIIFLTNTRKKQISWIVGLITIPILSVVLLFPNLSYLPPVKRDAIDATIFYPAELNFQTLQNEFAQEIIQRIDPYMKGEKEPHILNYYLTKFPEFPGLSLGIRAKDQSRVGELMTLVIEDFTSGFPGTFVFAQQNPIFSFSGGSNSIQVYLQSKNLEALRLATQEAIRIIPEAFGGGAINPRPDPTTVSPELRIVPDIERIQEAGWNRRQFSGIVQALGNGQWLGEYFDGDQRMDIMFKSEPWSTPEELQSIPLFTPLGDMVIFNNLADVVRDVGPSALQRYNGRRTYTLGFNPPDGMSLEETMIIMKEEIEPTLKALLPIDGTVLYGGSVNALNRAVTSLGSNFLLALGLLFLILAALFKSLKDSFLVLIAIPLATVGGVVAIRLMNLFTFQPMDLLTMIGFIILLGLVVNNAILLVMQARASEAAGLTCNDAVGEALKRRLRPILMSTLTSIFSMLPLLLFPGEGSVIYRGMAAVIVGGMSVSTIFTLILLPSLLQLEFKFGKTNKYEKLAPTE